MARINKLPTSGRLRPSAIAAWSNSHAADDYDSNGLYWSVIYAILTDCYAAIMTVYTLFLLPLYYFGVLPIPSASSDDALVRNGPENSCALIHGRWATTRRHLLVCYRKVQKLSFVFLPIPLSIAYHAEDGVLKPKLTLILALSFGFCLNSAITSTLFLRKGHALSNELIGQYWLMQSRNPKGTEIVVFWSCLITPLSSLAWSLLFCGYALIISFIWGGCDQHESASTLWGCLFLAGLLAVIPVVHTYHIVKRF